MTLQRYDVWEKEDMHKEPAGRFVELADVIKCLEKVAQSPHLNKIHLMSRLEVLKEIASELEVPIMTAVQKRVVETQDPWVPCEVRPNVIIDEVVTIPLTPNMTKKQRKGKEKSPPESQPCKQCGDLKATFAPDPYQSEINNDHTCVWMCDFCRACNTEDI